MNTNNNQVNNDRFNSEYANMLNNYIASTEDAWNKANPDKQITLGIDIGEHDSKGVELHITCAGDGAPEFYKQLDGDRGNDNE